VSKRLSRVVVFTALAGLAMLAAACGDSKPSAAPSVTTSPSVQTPAASLDEARLLDLHNVTLDERHRTQAFLRLDSAQSISIKILAKQQLRSCRVCQYADPAGGMIDTREITLTRGPEQYDSDLVLSSFRTPQLEPGYYRIDLGGKGLIISFSVDGRQ
jgi:hypothetical protein